MTCTFAAVWRWGKAVDGVKLSVGVGAKLSVPLFLSCQTNCKWYCSSHLLLWDKTFFDACFPGTKKEKDEKGKRGETEIGKGRIETEREKDQGSISKKLEYHFKRFV